MLSKNYRLTKRKAFNYIYKNGSYKSSENLTLMYHPAKTMRVGFSVSKKVGKAHIRNRIKRQLRAIVQDYLIRLNANYNYIIVAKPSITDKSFTKIREELFHLFEICGMINE